MTLPHLVCFLLPCPVGWRNKGWQLEQLAASGREVSASKKEDVVKHGKQVRRSHSPRKCDVSQVYQCQSRCVRLDRSFISEPRRSCVGLELPLGQHKQD